MSGMKPFDSDGFAHKSAVAQDTPSRREMLRTLAAASAASLVDPGEVLTRLAMDVPCVAGGPAGELLGTLPLFLERTSLTLFGDAGSAWCPGVYVTRPAPASSLCTRSDVDNGFASLTANMLASAGAELNVTAAVLSWDAPFRYRVGYAVPVAGTQFVPGQQNPTFYFTVGASF